MTSVLRRVQGYGGRELAAAAAADVYSMSGVSLAAAVHTAQHLNSLSRQIKSHLRHRLKSATGLTSITVHGY